jgi:hypothetical protein
MQAYLRKPLLAGQLYGADLYVVWEQGDHIGV